MFFPNALETKLLTILILDIYFLTEREIQREGVHVYREHQSIFSWGGL